MLKRFVVINLHTFKKFLGQTTNCEESGRRTIITANQICSAAARTNNDTLYVSVNTSRKQFSADIVEGNEEEVFTISDKDL